MLQIFRPQPSGRAIQKAYALYLMGFVVALPRG